MASLFNFLNSSSAVSSAGFMVGFSHDFKIDEKAMKEPLSSIFDASLSGLICAFGANMVSCVVPRPLTFIIPLVAGTSVVYMKYNDLIRLYERVKKLRR